MTKPVLPIIQQTASKPASPAEIAKNIRPGDIEGLKIVFINMPLRETAVPNTTPEGPLLMATNLRQNYGVDARIIDLNAYRIKDELAKQRNLPNGRHLTDAEVLNLISTDFKVRGEPDIVGFSGKITTLKWQEKIAKMVRHLLPDVFLVTGGGLATELKTGLFNYIPELDGAAHSEGDEVILKICLDAMTIKKHGLAGAVNSGKLVPYHLGYISGRHRFMYAGNRPENLDSLPFANLDLLAEDVFGFKILEYYLGNAVWGMSANNSSAAPFSMTRSTTATSGRGCPYGCEYCYRGAQGERKWGARSAWHIYNQLAHYIEKYGIDFHGFPDDNFAVTYDRIVDLVPLLRPLGIRWGTHTRLDEAAGLKPKSGYPGEYIFEKPLRIEMMAKAGCIYIGFGPESANAKVIEALGKGGFTLTNGFVPTRINGKTYNFPRSMIEGIKNSCEVGIHANCTWIKGNPTETLNDLKETVAFMAWQEKYYSQYGILPEAVNKRMFTLTWYPGTKIIHHPRVKHELNRIFGLNFNPTTHEPVCDEKFYEYCLALDDATKVLEGPDGEPLNFSDMSNDTFLRVRELVDSDRTLEILDM
ncbi:MAG: radical SAM protein [Candidatus Yanofskybacteria bacterium]|nr:radical SAM protein [Candidatus Yanofskybacteria bacterium]